MENVKAVQSFIVNIFFQKKIRDTKSKLATRCREKPGRRERKEGGERPAC